MSRTTYWLNSCPFCGTPPTIEPWHGGGPRKRMIYCDSDQCEVRPSVTGPSGTAAAASWNFRVPGNFTNVKLTPKGSAV